MAEICSDLCDREVTLVAERPRLGFWEPQIVGVARMINVRNAREAEVAVVVADVWQGKGLGTKLVFGLIEMGRTRGLKRLFGYVLFENQVMRHVCRKLGFAMRYSASEDALEAEIKLGF